MECEQCSGPMFRQGDDAHSAYACLFCGARVYPVPPKPHEDKLGVNGN